jgi:VIT1/CCC1 family predicted Fe2+/Mn2+ transporter
MTIALKLSDLKASLAESAGTIVFGMEDGTVSIFGLIFGVAATTNDSVAILVAGTTGAAAAAVSMMAGAYLDAETSQDEAKANRESLQSDLTADPASAGTLVVSRLAAAGLAPDLSSALAGAVQHDPEAQKGLLFALQAAPEATKSPLVQALWMLFADFLSAAVPILPFVLFPAPKARMVSAVVTLALLILLGYCRAKIAKSSVLKTVAKTVSIGIAAAVVGVGIGVFIEHAFGG